MFRRNPAHRPRLILAPSLKNGLQRIPVCVGSQNNPSGCIQAAHAYRAEPSAIDQSNEHWADVEDGSDSQGFGRFAVGVR
jgi:hypothetical protein